MSKTKKVTLLVNGAKCPLCGDYIESKDSKRFEVCKCGNISITGGNEYMRRIYRSKEAIACCILIFSGGVPVTLHLCPGGS